MGRLRKYKIIRATPYVVERGCKDNRLVVVKWLHDDGRVDEYSAHTQTRDGGLYQGHYSGTEKSAIYQAQELMAKHPNLWWGKHLRKIAKPVVKWD